MLKPSHKLSGQIAKASSSNAAASPPIHQFLDREFVVSASRVLDEGMPGAHDPGAAILPESSHLDALACWVRKLVHKL
jgi:hypothetical protein